MSDDFSFGYNVADKSDGLLDGLTEPQRRAVEHTDGPALVLAGPGSGKTRVITRRASRLATTVTKPWHVLAITFTNKAASEMQERISALGDHDGMTVCTFHSLCVRVLRRYHAVAGLAPNFTIFDQPDRRQLVKQAIGSAGLSTANFSPGMIDQRIGRAKNAMISPQAMADDAVDFVEQTVARVYGVYEELLASNQGLDFDDLLFKAAVLIGNNEAVAEDLQDRYRYVLVDEYQDTNVAQYRIANLLAQTHRNLFVTGDPDQSIYAWRGADIQNILSFEQDYPDAPVVRLEQNFRSSKRILAVADAVIAGNAQRKEKSLWTDNDDGAQVRVIAVEEASDEARTVVQEIASLIEQGHSPGDFAIFYRINSISRGFEEQLLRGGVPYRVARGTAFYARKEIRDVLAYLRVILNPADDVAIERIINTPARGIGKTTVDRVKEFAARRGCGLLEAVRLGCRDKTAFKRATDRLKMFADVLESMKSLVDEKPQVALEQTLLLSGLMADLKQDEDVQPERVQNVGELVTAAAEYQSTDESATLVDWLSYTSLLGDVDKVEGERVGVTLMTLHAAKGLEFPCVYIVAAEEDILPMNRGGGSDDELEEERRLMFVGMTRAMKRLTLSCSSRRMIRGAFQSMRRSSFLDEIPEDQLECIGSESGGSSRRWSPRTGELPDDIEQWEPGTLVRHPTHGLGAIQDMSRGARRTHVNVLFKNGHQQSWVLEFASLVRVEFDEVE